MVGSRTNSVLLDGPEIPLCIPRGRSEEFKRFNMMSHCWGFLTTTMYVFVTKVITTDVYLCFPVSP